MTDRSLYSESLLGDDILKSIGCVAVESALLDYTIDNAILDVCEFDGTVGNLVVGLMMLDKKIDFLRSAVIPLLRGDGCQKEFLSAFTDAKNALADRNIVIHGLWVAETMTFIKTDAGTTVTANGSIKSLKLPRGSGPARVFESEKVLDVAHRLSRARRDLVRVLFECTDQDVLRRNRDDRRSRREYLLPDRSTPKSK